MSDQNASDTATPSTPLYKLITAYAAVLALAVLALTTMTCSSGESSGGRTAEVTDDFESQFGHCLEQIQARAFESSLAACERAVILEPSNLSAVHNLGYALRRAGRYGRAEAMFRRVLERDPLNTRALYELGSTYLDKGDTEKARDQFEQVLEIKPDHGWARRRLQQLAQ